MVLPAEISWHAAECQAALRLQEVHAAAKHLGLRLSESPRSHPVGVYGQLQQTATLRGFRKGKT